MKRLSFQSAEGSRAEGFAGVGGTPWGLPVSFGLGGTKVALSLGLSCLSALLCWCFRPGQVPPSEGPIDFREEEEEQRTRIMSNLKRGGVSQCHYCLSDVLPPKLDQYRPFPIVSFNHITREVVDYRIARDFYVNVLGFIEIPRPPFENDGVWLYGFGVSIHLIKTLYPEKRKLLKGRRIEHFEGALPNVDHVAFVTSDINTVERQLVEHNVFYKRFDSDHMGIYQIFLFDPDANAIEISNCAPEVGDITCKKSNKQMEGLGQRPAPQPLSARSKL